MSDIIDTPLTRIKADYEARLAAKDMLISDMVARVETAQERLARVRGVNEMLRLLLADMQHGVAALASQVDTMARNINELRSKLPELE